MKSSTTVAVLSLTALVACGDIKISETCECGFYSSEDSSKLYHWADGADVQFTLNSSIPQEQRDTFGAIQSAYTSIFANTKVNIDTKTNSAPDIKDGKTDSVTGDGVNGVYWISGPWPFSEKDAHADAITVVQFGKGRIVETDIFFRADRFESTSDKEIVSTLAETPADFRTLDVTKSDTPTRWLYLIGIHEFGHALGRVHAPQSEKSIMTPNVSMTLLNNPFTSFDLEKFSPVYVLKEAFQ